MSVTLLDCTLRDGGYYNDWDFTPSLVRRYLDAVERSRIPIVELGFRTLERGRYLGPTAFTTDRYIDSLKIADSVTLGVMVNAKEIASSVSPATVVDELFSTRSDSQVSLVRLASHFDELTHIGAGVDRLLELGYQVGVNLMQIASCTPVQIDEFAGRCAEMGVDLVYFADSFGGMRPYDVAAVVKRLASVFHGPIGCHTHDNMSLAFANSLAAVDAGASFVDATVLGMGRGPGNARTEFLAMELAARGLSDVDGLQLIPLVNEEFADLQREFGWGANAYYFISAANNIHPTYIQEMTKDGRYSADEVVGALQRLREGPATSFNRQHLDVATQTTSFAPDDDSAEAFNSFDAEGWCADRDVLIVGPGPTGVVRRVDIESFIRDHSPIVIALNAFPPIALDLVNVYALCDPVRATVDINLFGEIQVPVFMPRSVIRQLPAALEITTLRPYELTVCHGPLLADSTECQVPSATSFPYALALAQVGRARRVFLTGFDGFDVGDPRQAEMETLFAAYHAVDGAPPIVALTKTSYPVEQSSLYAM